VGRHRKRKCPAVDSKGDSRTFPPRRRKKKAGGQADVHVDSQKLGWGKWRRGVRPKGCGGIKTDADRGMDLTAGEKGGFRQGGKKPRSGSNPIRGGISEGLRGQG